MAELGLLATVVQVADIGVRLSTNLYRFGSTVASADESIVFISKDITHTCSILNALEYSLKREREEHIYSHNAISTADTIVKECFEIFQAMNGALSKKSTRMGLDGGSTRTRIVVLERFKWPFMKPKIMLLWSHLNKLKSSLQLMLNVLIYARLVIHRPELTTGISDQRISIENIPHMRVPQPRKCGTSKSPMARDGLAVDPQESLNVLSLPIESSDVVTRLAGLAIENTITTGTVVPEVNTTTRRVEHYGALIDRLMQEIEASDHDIGDDMRSRIKDVFVRMHKREARILTASHSHLELKRFLPEKIWMLAGIEDEREAAGDPPIITFSGRDNFPAILDDQKHDLQSDIRFQDLGPHDYRPENTLLDLTASRMQKASTDFGIRRRVSKSSTAIDRFLEGRDDPWPQKHIVSDLSQNSILNSPEDSSWLPFQKIRTSLPASGRSQKVLSVVSSQVLPSLTEASDTGTIADAGSVLDELALEFHSASRFDNEMDGPLVVSDDQGYSDIEEQDGSWSTIAGTLASSNVCNDPSSTSGFAPFQCYYPAGINATVFCDE